MYFNRYPLDLLSEVRYVLCKALILQTGNNNVIDYYYVQRRIYTINNMFRTLLKKILCDMKVVQIVK